MGEWNMVRSLLWLAVAFFLAIPGVVRLVAQESNEFYEAAVQLYEAGEITSALEQVEYALKVEPRHAGAQALRRSILVRHGGMGELIAQQRRIESILIPEVKFHAVSFTTALAYLREQTKIATTGQYEPNFVVRSDQDLDSVKVNLELRNVPLSDALRYLCELAGVRYRLDRHAILIENVGGAAPPVSEPSSPTE